MFVDTSAWFALATARDSAHGEVRLVAERLSDEGRLFITSNFVVAETHALLISRSGRAGADSFLELIDHGVATVERIDESDEHRAREIIRRYADAMFTYVDATSFTIMDRLRVSIALTLDRHFAQYGFQMVPAG